MDKFNAAYDEYKNGNWSKAKEALEAIINERRDKNGQAIKDGPSETLLEVMERTNYQAPEGWAGFRALTEK